MSQPELGSGTVTALLEPALRLLRLAQASSPSDADQHLISFLKCLKTAEVLPEAAVVLVHLTNTFSYNPVLERIWDAFLLFSAIVPRPFESIDRVRAYLAIVATCTHSPPEVASSALRCLLRLSSPWPVRIPFNEDRPHSFLRTYARQPDAPIVTGVSIGEALLADSDTRRRLVPSVLSRLLEHIERQGGLEMSDIFEQRTVGARAPARPRPADVLARAAVGNLDPDADAAHVTAAALRLFLETLQAPVVPLGLSALLVNPSDAAQCIALTRRLPNEHRDVLMCIVAFVQGAVRAVELPGPREGIAKAFVNGLADVAVPWGPKEVKKARTFLRALVDNWRTTELGAVQTYRPATGRSTGAIGPPAAGQGNGVA
jgi:hypothetical protein